MILIPTPNPHPHLHPLHPPHPFQELADQEVGNMPESGDIDVMAAPRIHLASRRRFDLKLDLASAVTGRQRGEKRPKLDLLSAPAILTSKLSDSVSCSSCMGSPVRDSSPVDSGDRPLSAASYLGHTTCLGHPHACLGQQTDCLGQLGQTNCLGQLGQPPSCLGQLGQQATCLGQLGQQTTCTFRPVRAGDEERMFGPVSPSSAGPFRTISSVELACKLRKCRPMLVIDCRPFLCYNSHHVQGALNISCTDRFNRKRLQQGKVGVLDLLASTHGKDSFRRRHIRDVILYDDRGNGQHVLDSESALQIVLGNLHREGRQPAVLQGGLKQFEAEYPELCWSSRKLEMPGRLLCSPTNDTIEPEIETATASKVLPFLYLGNERDSSELERLRRHNITYVLNVTAHVPHYWQTHGVRYKRIPASDSAQQNLKQYFEEAIDFIDEARQQGANVLIHCHAGVSRSATITIAYILKHSKMAMGDAYKFVKSKRGIISPNFNFLGQLLEFEQDLNTSSSTRVLSPHLVGLDSTV